MHSGRDRRDVINSAAGQPCADTGRASLAKAAFTAGLDRILLVGAIVVLAAGVIALATIRGKDFSHQTQAASA